MVRLKLSIGLRYEIAHQPGDFIFNIHAARTPQQQVVEETLTVEPFIQPSVYTEASTGTRFMRMTAPPGVLAMRYSATVAIGHHTEAPERIKESPVAHLPPAVLPYLYPSRYCQSDRLHAVASREFGHLPRGYSRALAIRDWVRHRTTFRSGSSNIATSALDTVIEQVGVCREFAHLMIAMCRGVNIPARFVTGIDYGADPALGPPDFHAYVEAYLGDRWYLFDPTGISPTTGLIRIGTGRDAADVSFASLFGTIKPATPSVHIDALVDPSNGYVLPQESADAVSSMAVA